MKLSPKLVLAKDFIQFYFRARTIYQIDSPLIFSFCNEVLDNATLVKTPITNHYRDQCLKDNTSFSRSKINEKSRMSNDSKLVVKNIAKTASSSHYKYKRIVSLAKWNNCRRILELGTNLGFTALALAENGFEVDSVEGDKNTFSYVSKKMNHSNLNLHFSEFKEFLHSCTKKYDLIFIDGDHNYESTLSLVKKSKNLLNPNGLIIIDDIRWSSDMKRAWRSIAENAHWNLCLDLFLLGIVGKRETTHSKISLALLPKKFRPWPYYFFRRGIK